jgi:hypothetical protein
MIPIGYFASNELDISSLGIVEYRVTVESYNSLSGRFFEL